MRLSKMLLADVKGIQGVLELSNQKVIKILEDMLQHWVSYDSCPLFQITREFDREMDELVEEITDESYNYKTYENYSFQPYGRRGSSWWYRLFNDEKKEAIRLLIDHLEKEQENETQ